MFCCHCHAVVAEYRVDSAPHRYWFSQPRLTTLYLAPLLYAVSNKMLTLCDVSNVLVVVVLQLKHAYKLIC